MKRLFGLLVLMTAFAITNVPAQAAHRTVVRRGPHGRATVVIHRGHPIRRALPLCVVRSPRVAPRVTGAVFLPPVVFRPMIVVRPAPSALSWEDSDLLYREDDWTDLTLNANARGRRLCLEIAVGRAQLEFAEVVFDNGEVKVVDFDASTLREGIYPLADIRDGNKVDHVRLVARARSDRAKIVLMMER